MAQDLPPGVSITDIPGNRPQDKVWDKAHDLLDNFESPDEAILVLTWSKKLEDAAEAVRYAFAGDEKQTTIVRMECQAQALRRLEGVLRAMGIERFERDAAEPERQRAPLDFGGRVAGDPCGCGNVLWLTNLHVESPIDSTLDCVHCGASYREDGAHYCPACKTWPERWEGGTDADPRPVCCNCGADQPGWPPRKGPLVDASR